MLTADGDEREFKFNFWRFGLKILLTQQNGYELIQYVSRIFSHQTTSKFAVEWVAALVRLLGDPWFKLRHGYRPSSLRVFRGFTHS